MIYALVLAGFALCSVSLSKPNDPSLLTNENHSQIDQDSKSAGHGLHLYKTVGRQRRSVWTEFFNSLTVAAETFHMEPVLVEGVNGVENVGSNIKNKFRDKPKWANAMLSEGVGKGRLSKLDKDIIAYIKQADKIIEENALANHFEKTFIEVIESNVGESHFEGLDFFSDNGFNNVTSENYLLEFLKPRKELKSFVISNLVRTRDLRELNKKMSDELPSLPKYPDSNLSDEQLNGKVQELIKRLRAELYDIKKSTDKWLAYKRHPMLTTKEPIDKTCYIKPREDPNKDRNSATGKYEKELQEYVKSSGEESVEDPVDLRSKKLDSFKEIVLGIGEMSEHAEFYEQAFLEDVMRHAKDQSVVGLQDLPKKGMTNAESEKTLKDVIASEPDLKVRIIKNIHVVRYLRDNIITFEKKKMKEYAEFVKDEALADAIKTLQGIMKKNQKWLDYKTDPELEDKEDFDSILDW